MQIDDYILFLNNLYDVNNIPLCLFQEDELISQIPVTFVLKERVKSSFEHMKSLNKDVSYLSTPYEAFCGLVRLPEHNLWVFVGPYFLTPITKDLLPTIINQMHVPPEEEDRTKIFLTGLPYGPLHRFLSYLSCLNFALNHKVMTIDEIDYNSAYYKPPDIDRQYTNASYESRENEVMHNTYLFEMHRMDLIASGNTEAMKRNLVTPVPGRQGTIADNGLRQAKNIFISACAMYTRAAIAGGMDIEEAYNLSDVYIRTVEGYKNVVDVERLLKKMPMDFTERVEREVKFKNVSQPIMAAIHYIKEHVNQPLQAETIASHVNLSTSYFLKRFKAETGSGLSEFITNTKIEEACILLSYTDKSLTEISNYLYFSSQSYFQNVFKKVVGVTPGQYRNTKRKPVFMQHPG